jgi:hypothetical protein
MSFMLGFLKAAEEETYNQKATRIVGGGAGAYGVYKGSKPIASSVIQAIGKPLRKVFQNRSKYQRGVPHSEHYVDVSKVHDILDPDHADFVQDFVKHNPNLKDLKISTRPATLVGKRVDNVDYSFPGMKFKSQGIDIPKHINIPTHDIGVTAHELGHATDPLQNTMLKRLGSNVIGGGAKISVPLAFLAKGHVKNKHLKKVQETIDEHPYATYLGGHTVQTLLPEGRASYLGLKHIAKKIGWKEALRRHGPTLGRAWGTYAASAIPALAAIGAYKGIEHLSNKYVDRKGHGNKKQEG